MEGHHDVTQILQALTAGDDRAGDELFAVVYGELRRIARAVSARERPDHTLQPTAVVHEAYLRLVGGESPRWENRAHFFGAAAEAMRRILIDHARRKASLKRGGGRRRASLTDLPEPDARLEDLLALDQALDRLEERDPAMAEVVKLRYFAGLSVEETAKALGTSPRSVSRAWTAARSWLRRELGRA
ncbi:MAG TPA: sigma-70 family RNA polymerase sigma factor, partial [Thermoanaerobaculia bacterium]|nr:sigma-70 family RNA polymerase sigma factor [Thermoanaerobaculia bacterium]